MAERLDTRWLDAPDTRRYAISIDDLTGGRLSLLPGVEAIRLVTTHLEPSLRAEGHEPRLGKIVSGRGGCEAGLYFDRAFAEGAVVSLYCQPVATEVSVLVGRSSRLLRGVVWGALIGGCVLGWFVSRALFPESSLTPLLMSSLATGLVLVFTALFAAPRIPIFAGGSSGELADAIHGVIMDWIHGVEPKRKKRKTRRKKASGERDPES